jgi:hypothetical protein
VLIRPEEVNDQTVPVPSSHVGRVPVDDDGLLVDEEAGRAYPVNATASLLWTLLDGTSPLSDLVDDMSAAFGAPRPDVAGSVHQSVRTFGELGLLRNVMRNLASIPIDIEYVDPDECQERVPPESAETVSFDNRYMSAPPNA